MNTTVTSARELAEEVLHSAGKEKSVDVVVFPPFTNVCAVSEVLRQSAIAVGGQDVFWEEKGAYTGEISPEMLQAAGASWVITGHSERRHILGESNGVVNRKTRKALSCGLNVVLALGETKEEREAGRTQEVIRQQFQESACGVEQAECDRLVIAYEPVWAIGTGLTASPEQAQEVHATLRGLVAAMFGTNVADVVRIQYGGSVTTQNAAALLTQPDIDGALVGGASLKAGDFGAIVAAAVPGW